MIELVVVMGLAASGATALLRKFVDSFDGPIRIGPWVTTPKLWLLVAPMGCTTCMSGWMSIAEGVWLVGAQHFSP